MYAYVICFVSISSKINYKTYIITSWKYNKNITKITFDKQNVNVIIFVLFILFFILTFLKNIDKLW